MANESPIAPTGRTVRAVNLEPRGTACWRIEVDAMHVCDVEIAIDLDWRSGGTYRIFTPHVPAGYLSQRLIGSGKFARGSRWWTAEGLQEVLRVIVVGCIAPDAVEVAVQELEDEREGAP